MKSLAISSIAHIALKVADLDRSLAFYRDKLGFPEMMRLNHKDGSLMLVYLKMTETQFLELFPSGEGERAPGGERTAIHHFCLEVADMDATTVDLTSRGIQMTIKPQLGLDGNLQCWIEDPDGNRIEFMQMMPGCMQELATARLRAMG